MPALSSEAQILFSNSVGRVEYKTATVQVQHRRENASNTETHFSIYVGEERVDFFLTNGNTLYPTSQDILEELHKTNLKNYTKLSFEEFLNKRINQVKDPCSHKINDEHKNLLKILEAC